MKNLYLIILIYILKRQQHFEDAIRSLNIKPDVALLSLLLTLNRLRTLGPVFLMLTLNE